MRPEASSQPRSKPVPPPSTVAVLGVEIAIADCQQALDWIDGAVRARFPAYVSACSVHTVMAAREDPELWGALQGAALIVPAGQSLVWAMAALGHPQTDRVSGRVLLSGACARAVDSGQRFYLYGGRTQGTLVQLALNLRQRHPGLKIVGGYSPPDRLLTDEEQAAIAEEITHTRADVVWVGIGDCRQETWMSQMRRRLEAPVLVGVGAAFELLAARPWASSPAQDLGPDWAHRLMHGPMGSWRSHLRYHPKFVRAVARQLASRQRARQAPGGSGPQ